MTGPEVSQPFRGPLMNGQTTFVTILSSQGLSDSPLFPGIIETINAAFRKSHVEHPRGAFPAVNVGITHGQGTQRPVNLQTHELKGVVEELLADENVQRLATFGSGV